MAISGAERTKRSIEKRKSKGLKRIVAWVDIDDLDAIRELCKKSHDKRIAKNAESN